MKLLPCDTCHEPALASRGNPGILWSAGSLHDSAFRYVCRRCGMPNTVTSQRFAQLPEMTDAEIQHESCDVAWPPPEHPDHPDNRGKPGGDSGKSGSA